MIHSSNYSILLRTSNIERKQTIKLKYRSPRIADIGMQRIFFFQMQSEFMLLHIACGGENKITDRKINWPTDKSRNNGLTNKFITYIRDSANLCHRFARYWQVIGHEAFLHVAFSGNFNLHSFYSFHFFILNVFCWLCWLTWKTMHIIWLAVKSICNGKEAERNIFKA